MTVRPKVLLVHVGHGKTGSSYLQSALAASRGVLAQAGIAYPIAEDRAEAAQAGGISSGNLRYAPGALEALLRDRSVEGAQKVLISSESLFFTLLRGWDAFRAEAEAALPGVEVQVLLYTRDPVDHAVSCYHQDVKRGGFTGSFAENLAGYNMPAKVGQLLRSCAGARVPVTVRNYSRHSKTVLATFEDWLGLPPASLITPPVDQVNRSLTLAEIELQKLFNQHFGKDARRFVSDPLCTRLPAVRSETPPLSEADLDAFLARMQRMIEPAVFSASIPAPEAYHIGTLQEHAPRFAGVEDSEHLTFSRAQLAVFVETMQAELARVAVLRKQLDHLRNAS